MEKQFKRPFHTRAKAESACENPPAQPIPTRDELDDCDYCSGSGEGPDEVQPECIFCDGSGRVPKPSTADREPAPNPQGSCVMSWYFWKFVHNMLIHPLLAFPWEPKWVQRAHDWTAQRCKGGG